MRLYRRLFLSTGVVRRLTSLGLAKAILLMNGLTAVRLYRDRRFHRCRLRVIFLSCVLGMAGCGGESRRELPFEPITISLAIQGAPYSGLIAVADEQGFFRDVGVQVEIHLHPSGLDALQSMMRGEAQFATVADIAFASALDQDPMLRVIAAIGATSGSEIVARKDRNIREPADLKGKRIGFSPGTTTPYHLHSFLVTNAISPEEITAVPVPPDRQVEAVVSGEVDAVAAFEVYAFAAHKQLGENAVAWEIQNTLDYQWLLVSRANSSLPPAAARRLLKGLILAEEFIVNQPVLARAIISRKWEIEPELIDHLWSRTRLLVSFNQSIVTGLQTYVKWDMKNEGRTGEPPDVLTFLDTGPLEDLDPRLVTVFR